MHPTADLDVRGPRFGDRRSMLVEVLPATGDSAALEAARGDRNLRRDVLVEMPLAVPQAALEFAFRRDVAARVIETPHPFGVIVRERTFGHARAVRIATRPVAAT